VTTRRGTRLPGFNWYKRDWKDPSHNVQDQTVDSDIGVQIHDFATDCIQDITLAWDYPEMPGRARDITTLYRFPTTTTTTRAVPHFRRYGNKAQTARGNVRKIQQGAAECQPDIMTLLIESMYAAHSLRPFASSYSGLRKKALAILPSHPCCDDGGIAVSCLLTNQYIPQKTANSMKNRKPHLLPSVPFFRQP
jgi:hypothetical protein